MWLNSPEVQKERLETGGAHGHEAWHTPPLYRHRHAERHLPLH